MILGISATLLDVAITASAGDTMVDLSSGSTDVTIGGVVVVSAVDGAEGMLPARSLLE
ncbi:MAG: hypothetical protein U0236_05080 [Nitrospira sp.]